MIRVRIFIIWLSALLVMSRHEVAGAPADTLYLSDKENLVTSFASGFRGEVWLNPALYYHYTPFSWTGLEVSGLYHDKGAASLKQEGDRDTQIGVDVNSFVVLSGRSRVFGSAGYRNMKRENVEWNENLDWEMVAPYVTGDSIGGFLKGETYYFKGGYAHESAGWTWGVVGGYRASHNYRDKDPRPRNTSSDLTFAIGSGYRLGRYRLGVAANFRFYQQNSEITFLADKGSTSVYHMLGLGMDYVRFAGTQTGAKYQGTEWGGQVGLLPAVHSEGWSAQLSFNRMNMDKSLSGANHLTLLRWTTTHLKADVAWMQTTARQETLALKFETGHVLRQGKENIYGEAGGNSYATLISTAPGMETAHTQVGVQGLWEQALKKRRWAGALVPHVTYHRKQMDYKAVSRYVHLSAFEASLLGRLLYQQEKFRLKAEATGGYYAGLSARTSLPGLDVSRSSSQALLANRAYLSDSYAMMGAQLQGNYSIRNQYSLSLSVQWQTMRYKKSGVTRYAACSLGVFF